MGPHDSRTARPSVNGLAVVSIVTALLAVGSLVGLGISVLAAFAVGAGHVALHQIRRRGQQGRWLALAGMVIGYAIATWGLVASLIYLPELLAR